ncbi:hypothetical protein GCM10025876_23470 [Demequina litorisediminis]|uniref:Transcriptional regulator LacI/GalR-like sensor domain-containing protein n=2 Tax=Demequina litorisediminis TaxID=1849022 RepID=A0ABQ6IE45_9MICO|nr:hypothetical protein GCM10025876_23470 [Demequina litorisediminis]
MGLGALLIPAPRGDEGETSLLESAPMDAAVVLRVRDHDDPALAILRKRGLPVVVMDAEPPAGGGQVTIDDTSATVELIEHLVSLGHERIGTITLPHAPGLETSLRPADYWPETSWAPMHHRLEAFRLAGVRPCVVVESRESMVAEGIAAGHLALAHESQPTALVVQSDLLAAGVVLAARELDLSVPGDVSITGFDGLDLPWLAPLELTTVYQDGVEKGHALAKAVKDLLAGEEPASVLTPLEPTHRHLDGPGEARGAEPRANARG